MKKTKKIKKLTKKRIKQLEKRERNKKDKEWQAAIRLRDSNKCVICGESKIVHCHHLFPREIKEFRWNINNGVALCPKHHKFSLEISPHRNPFIFVDWFITNRNIQFNKLMQEYLNGKM
jgi:hypothetical protein